jgi:hypothetical protein
LNAASPSAIKQQPLYQRPTARMKQLPWITRGSTT